jgi:hypothetical protein
MSFFTDMIKGIADFLPTSVRRENEVDTYTAGLFGLCLIVVIVGLLIVLVASLQRPTTAAAISTGSVALLSALMCFAGGAILGLLFGVPRYTKTDGSNSSVAPNNNLEQVSDWLTKMIVGITLVQFGVIVQKTKVLARQINDAMLGCASACPDNYALGLAIVGFFAASGFLMMYLWSRIYLLLDVDRVQHQLDLGAAKVLELAKQGAVLQTKTADRGRLEQKTQETVANLVNVAEIKPGVHRDDPWKGVFGGKSKLPDKGRELAAEVKQVPGSEYCSLRLTVRSTDRNKPLAGTVKFFLHDTFPEPIKTVPVEDGVATLMAAAWGAFTVGALADEGATQLELDLSQESGAPADWRSR